MVFVVEEKRHEIFRREGDDLVMDLKVGLVDALAGVRPEERAKEVKGVDGKTIKFEIPFPVLGNGGAPVKSGQVIKVVGEVRFFLPSFRRTQS